MRSSKLWVALTLAVASSLLAVVPALATNEFRKYAEMSIAGPANALGAITVKIVKRGADSTASLANGNLIVSTSFAYDGDAADATRPTTAIEIRDAVVLNLSAAILAAAIPGYTVGNAPGVARFFIQSTNKAPSPEFDVFVAVPHVKVIPPPGPYGPINGVTVIGEEKTKAPGISGVGLILVAAMMAASGLLVMWRRTQVSSA